MPQKNSPAATFGGLALAGTGVAHFVKPALFESITAPAFPNDTATFIYVNGAIETALGLGLAVQQTRKAALAGLAAYGVYLAGNAIRNR